MSIEYTLDIQLTELGFPDILQPRETSTREAPCPSSDGAPSPSPTALPTAHKPRLLVRDADAAKQTANAEQTAVVFVAPRPDTIRMLPEPLIPAQSLRSEQSVKGAAEEQLDESDDSEVSETYDEEEVDEEEEDEEGLNESGLSGDWRCSVCNLQLSSEFKLQDHMNLHTGARPYCCAECGKRFCQIHNYRVHLRTHAQTKVDSFQCRICLRSFATEEDLKVHLSETHFEKEFYECDLCKRVFTSLRECQYHVQLHRRRQSFMCETCGHNFPSLKYLERHRRRTCQRIYKCTDCAKTFTKKNAVLKHSFTHLGLLPYTCVRCRCHFRLARLYCKHKCEPERIHCVACLREFLSQEDFQQHKKDTGCWGNQEPKGDEIRCLECGQRFDTTEELKKHAGAHQRVLKCAECGKGFRSALLLMSHMGGHAGKSPCLCQSCGLGFPHQQNYDSHLKTCGQTPQPARAPKKRQASNSTSSETKTLNAKPDKTNTATPTPAGVSEKPAAVIDKPAAVLNKPAQPVKDSSRPGPATGGVSAGSGPPDGSWKLTLDKQPPAGVELVLFLPVCPIQTNDLTVPSAVCPPLLGPAVKVQPQTALDLVTGTRQHPESEAPLDLSTKSCSSKAALSDILPPTIKSELEECEISGQADRQQFKNRNSKEIVKSNPGGTDTSTEVKQGQMDPMDLSPLNVNAPSSQLIMDIKEEPQSPGPDFESWSSRSSGLSEKDIKMEIDVSQPSYAEK